MEAAELAWLVIRRRSTCGFGGPGAHCHRSCLGAARPGSGDLQPGDVFAPQNGKPTIERLTDAVFSVPIGGDFERPCSRPGCGLQRVKADPSASSRGHVPLLVVRLTLITQFHVLPPFSDGLASCLSHGCGSCYGTRTTMEFASLSFTNDHLERVTYWIAVSAVCIIAVCVGLSVPTNHDESQYLSAAYLSLNLEIYKDFFYSQTPYYAILLGRAISAFDFFGFSPLVAGRIFNALWSCVFFLSLATALTLTSPRTLLNSGILICALASSFLDVPIRTARNDMMPLALTTLALAVFMRSMKLPPNLGKENVIAHFVAGIFLGMAVCSKQSYAFIALGFGIYAAFFSISGIRFGMLYKALPLALGGIVSALPALAMILPAIDNFTYSTAEFFLGTAHAQWDTSLAERSIEASNPLAARANRLLRILRDKPFLALVAGMVFTCMFHLYQRTIAETLRGPRTRDVLILCALCAALVLLSCTLARPVHRQYLAPLIPFFAVGLAALTSAARTRLQGILTSVILLLGILFNIVVLEGPLGSLRAMVSGKRDAAATDWRLPVGTNTWIATHAHQVRTRLHEVLGSANPTLNIATLMSEYPLDAGFGIYPEFAGAPFFFRSNDELPLERLKQLVGTAPRALRSWLTEHQVTAILVGYDEASLEEGFLEYARASNFACFSVSMQGAYHITHGQLLVARHLARVAPDCTIGEIKRRLKLHM
jgi:hypothetical protein